MEYKRAIIELVNKIHKESALKRVYNLVLYLWTQETGS